MKIAGIVGALAGAMLLVALPAVHAADTPISASKLALADWSEPSLPKTKRAVSLVSKDSAIAIPAEGGSGDPLVHGGRIEVLNTSGTGESVTIQLPAENWWRIPQDPNGGLRGWKYKEEVNNLPTDRYRIFVLFKQSAVGTQPRLKMKVRDKVGNVITYTLNEESQGSIGVRFLTGSDQHCVDSSDALRKKDLSRQTSTGGWRGRFLTKDTPPPLDCDLGSPSAAFLGATLAVFD